MTKFNIILLYIAIAAMNGIVPAGIAFWLSTSSLISLVIWGIASICTFAFICFVCLGSAMKAVIPELEKKQVNQEFNEAVV